MPWAAIQDGDAAALAARVLPADRAVGHLPAASLSPKAGRRLAHGQTVHFQLAELQLPTCERRNSATCARPVSGAC